MSAVPHLVVAPDSRNSGAALRIESVSKTFRLGRGEFVPALDQVSISAAPGEFIAVVGPSGCGKSTLLRIAAGLEEPDSGKALIGEQPPEAVTKEHRIGVAFQDHALLPWLSVAENIMLPARLAGLSPDRARMMELAKLVGLSDFTKARPKQLSGGMRQRVAIARAMMLEPILLLFDEPFGALDLVTRRSLNIEMQRIWSELGTTTMLITHSVDEAVQLADRVYVMASRPGRIFAEIPIHLDRPRDRRVTTTTAFLNLVQEVSVALDDASDQSAG
ncbi:MAG: ABC transporter ATP-binding protein [Rhizobiaceae bacterium]|nr:ABC transporter ATP-binding protein [Rhizobiaceae bacterium]